MDASQELRRVFEAIRDRRLDPALAAEVATDWSPTLHPSFLDYLASRDLLKSDREAPATEPATPDRDPEGMTTARDPGSIASTVPAPAVSAKSESTATFDGPIGTHPEFDAPGDRPTDPSSATTGLPTGRYEPIRLHRSGGLGQVWLARDTVLGREVAMKVVRPDRVGLRDYLSRFVREARVTGRLEHPGIVPLYDLIEADESQGTGACYVMRFVSGATLAEAITAYHTRRKKGEEGPLELRTLLDALIAVCQAVAFAHSRGVLHRDLKGQNVVLGDFGEVFLLDWGLNKGMGDDRVSPLTVANGESGEATGSNGIAGTPAYMAPEVAAGHPSTQASDVYGLGAILYSILTGKAPASGPTPDAILKKVQSSDPTSPRLVNPSTSTTLEAVCRKSMSRDPSARYPSADLLASDLRRWLADEPVSACRDPWPTRAARWSRRHRTAVAAAAVMLVTAVIALSIGSVLLFQEQKKTEAEVKKTRTEWIRAENNLDAAHLLTIQLIEITEKILPPVRGSELARRDLTHAAVETYEVFAKQRPDSIRVRRWGAQLNRYEANLHRLLDETNSAESAYQFALNLLRADTKNPDRLAETLRDYAGLQARTGRLKEALATLDEALVIAEGLRKVDPALAAFRRIEASIHADRSGVATDLGRYEEAGKSADQAIDRLGKLIEAGTDPPHPYDPLLLAASLGIKAVVECERTGYAAALPSIKDARKRAKALIDAKFDGANLDDALFTQAVIEYQASRIWLRNSKQDLKSNAEANLGELVTRLADLTRRHPSIPLYRGWLAKVRLSLGEVQELRGRPADARKSFEAARIDLERLIDDSPKIPGHRADLGRINLGLGRVARTEGDSTAAGSFRQKGLDALKGAALAAPDDVEIRKSLTDALAVEGR